MITADIGFGAEPDASQSNRPPASRVTQRLGAEAPTLALRVDRTPPPTWTCRTGVVVTPPLAWMRAPRLTPLRLLLGTISSSARQHAAGCCFVPDCERVLVTAGGAAGTSDGDERFASVVSTAGR